MTSVTRRPGALVVFALACVVTVATSSRAADDFCGDTGDPLLGMLQNWVSAAEPDLGAGYCAFASGAALAVAYDTRSGFHFPLSQRLLWPGNLLALADTTFAPERPATMEDARDRLLDYVAGGRNCLLVAGGPLLVYGVDSSFGEPWFFIARCVDGRADSLVWDPADLRRNWWRWADAPGANTIWPRPERVAPRMGRRVVRGGMRNLVLAARPDTVDGRPVGLAALHAALESLSDGPGAPETLSRLTDLRQMASEFLGDQADLWSPAEREPVKLAAYYLQKDAEAWRTLAAVAGSWSAYDTGQQQEWISAVIDWETRAAVALDALVSNRE